MMAAGGQVLKTEEVENSPGFPDGIKGYRLAEFFERQPDGFSCDMYWFVETAGQSPAGRLPALLAMELLPLTA